MAGKFIENAVRLAERCRLIKPQLIAKARYYCKFRRWPDIKHPKNINEKVMFLSFYTDTSEWTRLADKLQVRDFVESRGLGDTLPKLYASGASSADIDWDALPETFVAKTNHGCGTVRLIHEKSKTDLDELKRQLDKWLKTPFGYATAEPHYTRIEPRIIIEEMIPCEEGTQPNDYKFWCFDGKVYGCLLCTGRNSVSHKAFYNWVSLPEWEYHPEWMPDYSRNNHRIARPEALDQMMEVASKLSKGFPEVRVDLYFAGGRIFFGEMTFTSNGARDGYSPDHALRLGDQLQIPTD